MITATLLVNKKQEIEEITISGHAYSNVKGKDLVCAAVSAISVGAVNALTSEVATTIEETVDDGFVQIKVLKQNPLQQNILLTLSYQLETLSVAQPKYITFRKQEV